MLLRRAWREAPAPRPYQASAIAGRVPSREIGILRGIIRVTVWGRRDHGKPLAGGEQPGSRWEGAEKGRGSRDGSVDPVGEGEGNRLHAPPDAKLLIHVSDVALDGVDAEDQPVGDLLARAARRDQAQHFDFTGRQAGR